jgi:hypothetical protein
MQKGEEKPWGGRPGGGPGGVELEKELETIEFRNARELLRFKLGVTSALASENICLFLIDIDILLYTFKYNKRGSILFHTHITQYRLDDNHLKY